MTTSSSREPIRPLPEPIDATRHLDPRVWMVWLAAAIIPALAGRNPFSLLALLIVVVVIRLAWAPGLTRDTGWSVILRFAIIAALISVAFNLLTAPFGDQVLLTLPDWWPLGDVVTANALVYGLLSAVAVVVIILAGTTVGSLADWPELLRSVPSRLLPLAVAGSVAWAFVPQTIRTLRDIRDAQRVRGITVASARTLVPIIVPLLATSLDRATTMAEALESRGFGGSAAPSGVSSQAVRIRSLSAAAGLTLGIAGIYLLLDGSSPVGLTIMLAGALLIALALAGGGGDQRSRYRSRVWRRRDWWVLVTSLASLLVTGLTLATDGAALRYTPYPDILAPVVGIPLMVAIGLLLAPAVVAPVVPVRRPTVKALLEPEGSRPGERPLPLPFPRAFRDAELTPSEGERLLLRKRRSYATTPGTRRHQAGRSLGVRPRPWATWPPALRSGPALPQRHHARPIVEKRLVRS